MAAINRILVAVDFSASSRAAIDYALQLADALGAAIEVLHVRQPSAYVGPDALVLLPELSSEKWDEARDEMLRELDRFIGARRAGRGIELKIESGIPADVIPAVAREDGATLIVMGTHGRSGLSRLVVGSVAESVMRKAHCPVLTVRVPVTRPSHEAVPM